MNKYELLYIIDNDVTEEGKQAVIDRIEAVVTGAGGEIVSLDKWGNRKFAYPINFKNEGYYVLTTFNAPASVPAEITRLGRIVDEIVRLMIVRK